MVVTGVLAAGIVVLAFMNYRQQPMSQRELVRFEISNNSGFFNVSPDGQKILFAGVRNDGSRGVFIRSIDSTESKNLPEVLQDVPFWSPDSRYIAFVRDGKLRKLELASGSTQII